MDTAILASSFASIVGLICNYMSEHRASSGVKFEDFLSWLEEKHHSAIRELIISNQQLTTGLEHIFRQGNESIMNKLDTLDKTLATVAAHFDGFREIASLSRQDKLSDQAIKILKQFYESEGTSLLEIKFRGYTSFQVLDGQGGMIEIHEERFLDDDLSNLCELGFFLPNVNKQGHRVFRLTRQAALFISQLNGSRKCKP